MLQSSLLVDVEVVIDFDNVMELILAHPLLYESQGSVRMLKSLDDGACKSTSGEAVRLPSFGLH